MSTPNISASVTDAVIDNISPVPSLIASPSFDIVLGLDDVDDERLSAEEPVALLSPSIIHTSESEGGYGIDSVNSDPNDETHGADPITIGIESGDDEQLDGDEYHPQEESGSEAGSGTEAEALELNVDLKEEFAKFLKSRRAKKEHKAMKNPTKKKSDHKVNWIPLYHFLTSLHWLFQKDDCLTIWRAIDAEHVEVPAAPVIPKPTTEQVATKKQKQTESDTAKQVWVSQIDLGEILMEWYPPDPKAILHLRNIQKQLKWAALWRIGERFMQ